MTTALRRDFRRTYGDLLHESDDEIRFYYPVSQETTVWRRRLATKARGASETDVFEAVETREGKG
jgi:hypothetical protein